MCDTKKEYALSITFLQCDWFISQNECSWSAVDRFHSHTTKKIKSKPFNEKGKNLECCSGQITSPILRSVLCIVSELFVEAFHVPLQSFVWSHHVGAPPLYTNMAARNQQEHVWSSLCNENAYFSLMWYVWTHFLIVLEMLKLLTFIGIDISFQPNCFVPWCHARWQFGNS